MDGSLGPSAQSVNDVSKNIDQNVDVDVCLWDERLFLRLLTVSMVQEMSHLHFRTTMFQELPQDK